ncbi:M20/M25/M40 family metallo-hydrolase [Candidatus Vidania fulgoroideorum]
MKRIFSIINNNTCIKYIYYFLKKYGFYGIVIKKKKISNLLLFNSNSKKIGLMFLSHIDTVHEGSMKDWYNFPYSDKIRKRKIISRGAVDMKGSIISFILNLKKKIKKSIVVVISGDEEGEAKYGSRIISKYLKKNKYIIDLTIVGEPTSKKYVCDTYRTSRRGSANIEFTLRGKSGHTAFSNGINPLEKAYIFNKLRKYGISIVGINTKKIIYNVTPSEIKVHINIRYKHMVIFNKFIKYSINLLKKHKIKTSIKVLSFIKPFSFAITNKYMKIIERNNLKLENYLGGTSDGRFFKFSNNLIEIGLKNKYIHMPNERCKIRDIEKLSDLYNKFLI